MTEDQIKDRLEWLANAKPGQSMPDWMFGETNNWGSALSELSKNTLNLIKTLESKLENAEDPHRGPY